METGCFPLSCANLSVNGQTRNGITCRRENSAKENKRRKQKLIKIHTQPAVRRSMAYASGHIYERKW